jgi:hypothetical protein
LIAYVFFQDGQPVDCFFFSKKSRNTHSGVKIIDHVLRLAAEVGASLNLYRRTGAPKAVEIETAGEPVNEKIIDFLKYSFHVIHARLKNHSQENRFEQFFTDACIALTDQFPFLHPFAGVISLSKGNLAIVPEVDLPILLSAINSCLSHAFKAIATVREDLPSIIRTDIKQALNSQFQELRAWRIDLALPVFFANG